MKKQWIAAFAVVGLVAALPAAPATAHSDKYFDSKPSPHGGQRRMTGPYHIELVRGDGEVTIYLTNHADRPLPTAGGEGKAVVRAPSGETSIPLAPVGDNVMKGKTDLKIKPDTTVVVFVKLPGKEAYGAKFTPFSPTAANDELPAGMDHMDHSGMDHGDMDHMDHGGHDSH